MKKLLICALMLFQLCGPAASDEKLELSQQDAEALQAFLLSSELLDFGRRTSSPKAYLMAAELMLDYPTVELMKARILVLCRRAREHGLEDLVVQRWAEQLELRLNKTTRNANSPFHLFEGTLEPDESVEFEGLYRAGWVTGEGIILRVLSADKREVMSGEHLVVTGDGSRLWRVTNKGKDPAPYRLLLREQ